MRATGWAVSLGLILGMAIRCFSFDWPVEQKVLTATFGESRYGRYYPAIDLGGGRLAVFPIADGELIFFHEEGTGYHSIPRGNGTFVALLHEGGIQSVYSHLAGNSVQPSMTFVTARPKQIPADIFEADILASLEREEEREALRKGLEQDRGHYYMKSDLRVDEREYMWQLLAQAGYVHPLGYSGDTGACLGVRLSLMIIDVEEGQFLNPIKTEKPPLQPPLTGPEGASVKPGPLIGDILLRKGSHIQKLSDGMTVGQGEGEIIVEIYDESDFVSFRRSMAPYRISLAVSGKITRSISFESIEEKNGRRALGGESWDHDDLYYGPWLYRMGAISLLEGNSHLRIRTEDFAGVESVRDINLTVVVE
jgi:hypothetical protein